MSTLVTCFSHTGHTAALAHQIAMRLGATEDPILERGGRSGIWGIVTGALAAALGLGSRIAAPERHPAGFDLVVIGTPVWSLGAAPAVNRYIDQHRRAIGKVAFFCTEDGAGGRGALARMERRLGKVPVARLVVTEADLSTRAIDKDLGRFVAEIGAAQG